MKSEGIISRGLLLAGLWLGILFVWGGTKPSPGGFGAPAEWGMKELEALPPGLVLIDFYSVHCGPCRDMAPVLEEAAAELGSTVRVAKVDAEKSPGAAANFGIRVVPTFVLLRNGAEVDRWSGKLEKSELVDRVVAHRG